MDVFVSHSHEDDGTFRQVSKTLSDAGIRTFEPHRMPVGSSWVSGIDDAIRSADAFIILVSRAYLESEFSRLELATALAQSTDTAKPIIPVIVDPNLKDDDVPTLLARYQWLDLRDPTMRATALGRLTTDLMEPRTSASQEALTREQEALRLQLELLMVERAALAAREMSDTRRLSTVWMSIIVAVTAAVAVVLALSPVSDWVSSVGAGLASATGILTAESLLRSRRIATSTNKTRRSDD